MDNQKDTNLTNVQDKTVDPNFVVLKAERLTSALYLVTSLISDNDPLKWKLREKALHIFEGIKKIKETKFGTNESVLVDFDPEHIVGQFDEIMSLIEVAMSAGTVSTMNLALLKQEYNVLKNYIADLGQKKWGQFLMTDMNHRLSLPKGHIGQNLLSHKKVSFSQPTNKSQVTHSIKNSSPSLKGISSDSSFKTDRQVKIKASLKDKSWTSITDIAVSVPGCSIKTIQRDLSEMVDQGLLRKKGDRRWSRYMLA